MSRPPVRPRASAIVCTKGRGSLLPECLAALVSTLRDGDELILVEAGGTSAAGALEDLGPVAPITSYLRVEPPGKCRQLNEGIRMSTGEILLFTDDDVRVPPTWADEMAACFDDPGVGLACGPVTGLSRVPGVQEAPVCPPGEAPFETWKFAHGAAMAVRRTAAVEAGGFDERMGPGTPVAGEDHDFVLRVRGRGWRVMRAGGPAAQHLDWRTEEEDRGNALLYEKGGGAVVGAALRRSHKEGWPVLRRRLGYQRDVFSWNRSFGLPALAAFTRGLAYGLRLAPRDWLSSPNQPPGQRRRERRIVSAAGWRSRRARSS